MTFSRRDFLRQATTATAMGAIAVRDPRRLWTAPPEELFDEIDEAELRELATIAVDEARKAGATFADVRIHVAHAVMFTMARYFAGSTLKEQGPGLIYKGTFGVRALVDGAWGFTGGITLSREEVADGARSAVSGARANRPRHRKTLELAPVLPVAKGTWSMRIAEDPFRVPFKQQREIAKAALAQLQAMPNVKEGEIGAEWRKFVTVFASTEGSLTVQRRRLAMPGGSVKATADKTDWRARAIVDLRTTRSGPYGFEALGAEKLNDGVREAAERAIAASGELREGVDAEVGRYDLVFTPSVVNQLIGATLSPALELPRVLGYLANREGTSFAAPPADVLGRMRIASPLITLRGDRTQNGGAATTAWDEEGVTPDEYTFIDKGVVTDYHTNRQTGATLAGWYQAKGEAVRSHGCMGRTGEELPDVYAPNMTMTPGPESLDLNDLIADTKRGYFIAACAGQSDQQLLNTQFGASRDGVRKIVDGKLGPHIDNLAFQFITQSFWKSVVAIGGVKSLKVQPGVTNSDDLNNPGGVFPLATFSTVPMRVRDVNVFNMGRTA